MAGRFQKWQWFPKSNCHLCIVPTSFMIYCMKDYPANRASFDRKTWVQKHKISAKLNRKKLVHCTRVKLISHEAQRYKHLSVVIVYVVLTFFFFRSKGKTRKAHFFRTQSNIFFRKKLTVKKVLKLRLADHSWLICHFVISREMDGQPFLETAGHLLMWLTPLFLP